MKVVLQRVSRTRVSLSDGRANETGKGLLVLVGVENGDSEKDALVLLEKIINMRIFEDEKGKLNLSLLDIEGDLMLVSQFTLLADTSKGRRPSFHLAGDPKASEELFCKLVEAAKTKVKNVESGWFGEKMQVELINDGPVTIIL